MLFLKNMRRLLFFPGFISLLLIVACGEINNHPQPVTPGASDEAEDLLGFLYQIKGNYVLSGQHNYISGLTTNSDFAKDIGGSYPVIWGGDFSWRFINNNKYEARKELIAEAKRQYEKGSIITLMWHSCFPADGTPCKKESIWATDTGVTKQQWKALTTPGTQLHSQWQEEVDSVAFYLKQLKDAHVPVLWRPYHEMNGVWFWWCNKKGDDGYIKLWKMLFDRLAIHHGLDNLLWVWNANAPRDIPGDEAYPYHHYYPGGDYVDILATDVYRYDYEKADYDSLLNLANGKPIALGEVGELPSLKILKEQKEWTWFMTWANFIKHANEPDSVKKLYQSERVITLDELEKSRNKKYNIINE